MSLYCRFMTSSVDPAKKKIVFGSSIDHAYSVKMAGYWSRFFCVFMDLDFVFENKNANKRTWPLSNHLYRTRMVNTAYILT